MTVLLFNHEGWEVATAAWTAAAKPGKKVQVSYQWGADRISFFDSATGNAKTTLDIGMDAFLAEVARGGTVDLREFSPG